MRLLDRAKCTVNFSAGNIFTGEKSMSMQQRVDFLATRLRQFGIKGYSRGYIEQLVRENIGRSLSPKLDDGELQEPAPGALEAILEAVKPHHKINREVEGNVTR